MEKLKHHLTKPWIVGTLLLIVAIICFFLGTYWATPSAGAHQHKAEKASSTKAKLYTCSMHPSIRLTDPKAKCPICGMDLIPVSDDGDEGDGSASTIKLTPYARSLASVETFVAQRKSIAKSISLFGKISVNENHFSHITARVKGRVEKLYVNYDGISVNKGEHLLELYSPEIFTAQEELLSTLKSGNTGLPIRQAIRKRLSYWGLNDAQISDMDKNAEPSYTITLHTPISGTVLTLKTREGKYVKEGDTLYTIANLKKLWVNFEAYESDIPFIQLGQKVSFETRSYPGEKFVGTVSFIKPVLNSKTRTVTVRAEVDNKGLKLKPDMFVRGFIEMLIDNTGTPMKSKLIGSFICSMHPEIIKNEAGVCDLCGMELVPFDSISPQTHKKQTLPLIIPDTAPLITGKRAVIFVEQEPGSYEARTVTLGHRVGHYYQVLTGLKEGEKVVSSGNFKIDSALQILGKKSMMNLEVEIETTQTPELFRKSLTHLFNPYLRLQQSLAADNLEQGKNAVKEITDNLDKIRDNVLGGVTFRQWRSHKENLRISLDKAISSKKIAHLRDSFNEISAILISIQKEFQYKQQPLNVAFCPMAFDKKGAYWLQKNDTIKNPYFGASMLSCGSIEKKILSRTEPGAKKEGKLQKMDSMKMAPNHWLHLSTSLAFSLATEAWKSTGEQLIKLKKELDKLAQSLPDLKIATILNPVEKMIENLADHDLLRQNFADFSEALIVLLKKNPSLIGQTLYIQFCPMAFDNEGAHWLSAQKKILNPYFGSAMLNCGSTKSSLKPLVSSSHKSSTTRRPPMGRQHNH